MRQDGWQVIDMLEAAPRQLTEAELLSLLRPLAPRYFSIASSRKAVPDEAHLLIAAVRYETHGRRATASPRWMWRSGARQAIGCGCS